MKRIYLFIVFALTLCGCGTVKGLGQDLSTVGRWLTKSSEKIKGSKTSEVKTKEVEKAPVVTAK